MAVAIAVIPLSLVTIARERRVIGASQALSRDLLTLNRGGVARSTDLPIEPDDPARVLVSRALLLARAAAAQAPGRVRDTLLARASLAIDKAVWARPGWGEAELVSAFIATQRAPGGSEARAKLAASYRDAPFLIDAAPWRVGQGLAQWDALEPPTRGRLIREAVLIARLDSALRGPIFDMARQSDAYFPLSVAWHGLRVRDADRTQASERASPD